MMITDGGMVRKKTDGTRIGNGYYLVEFGIWNKYHPVEILKAFDVEEIIIPAANLPSTAVIMVNMVNMVRQFHHSVLLPVAVFLLL
jgi:hypothetical protein